MIREQLQLTLGRLGDVRNRTHVAGSSIVQCGLLAATGKPDYMTGLRANSEFDVHLFDVVRALRQHAGNGGAVIDQNVLNEFGHWPVVATRTQRLE